MRSIRSVRSVVVPVVLGLLVASCAVDPSLTDEVAVEASDAATSGTDAGGADDPAESSAPEPAADEDGADSAAPDVAPAVIVETLPGHRQESVLVGLTGFWWGPSAFAEVAQSVRIPRPLQVAELRFGIDRVSALEDWENAPDEMIAFDHDVRTSGIVEDVRVRLTIWQLDSAQGPELSVEGLEPVYQQFSTLDFPIVGLTRGGRRTEEARLVLDQPVSLDAGSVLISLGLDSFGPPEVFNTYVVGRNHGTTDATGFNQDGPPRPCVFEPTEDRYTRGRAYYRVFDHQGRPVPLASATNDFREHRAKVQRPELDGCEGGDYFLPGDIELTLVGR